MFRLFGSRSLRALLVIGVIFVVSFLSTRSCGKSKPGGSGLNLFSIEDEIRLGRQVEAEILQSGQYRLLSRDQYPAAYAYLDSMTLSILNSGQVVHADKFEWRLYIIHDDQTLNAFAAPGGKIFVFTGLIKFLNQGSSLAGVLGHEIAHADQRHSTAQLTKVYGIQALLALVTEGRPGMAEQIAHQLLVLNFSREHEAEADHYSVLYLCPTSFEPDGAADFFEKLTQEGQSGQTPEFLSTHPSPENRVPAIRENASQRDCGRNLTDAQDQAAYRRFVQALP